MRLPQPHVQRGIRLAIAVFIACVIGYGVILPRGGSQLLLWTQEHVSASVLIYSFSTGVHDHYAKQWIQSFKWCAITCVVRSLFLCLLVPAHDFVNAVIDKT